MTSLQLIYNCEKFFDFRRSNQFHTGSCEAIPQHFPIDDDDSICSSGSLQSLEFPDTKTASTFNASIVQTNSRSSKDSGKLPMFYKSAQTLHPSSNLVSSPAVSCTRLKGFKKPKKDLWKAIKVSRNLSWGRKPLSRPWISIAGRNEKPYVKKRQAKLPESTNGDDNSSITNVENTPAGYVSITVDSPSDPNIADDFPVHSETAPEKDQPQKRDNKPTEKFPQRTSRDRTNIKKQQSLDETSKSRLPGPDYVRRSRVYQSLPALENAQITTKNLCQEPEKTVRWRSDTIQQTQFGGNEFRKHPPLAPSASFSKERDKKTLEKKPSLKRQDSARTPAKSRHPNHSADSSPSRGKPTNQNFVKFKDDDCF